jgi:hypothetical protein
MTEMQNTKIRFDALRKRVMNAIAEELKKDGHCKSYEGTFEWTTCYPNYFEDPEGKAAPDFYVLRLHCYVLGGGRHYEWCGETRTEVLEKAEKEIDSWLKDGDA